jgi:hypothetical protein
MSEWAHPRKAGDRAEGAVCEVLPWLRYVTDETAQHYDAEARQSIGPVESGDPVEIKSALVALADGGSGRFYLRRKQHERLLEVDGWYLFAVCTPQDREVLAWRFVRAVDVDDELLPVWWDGGDGRADYRQLTWTALFDEDELEEPADRVDDDLPPKWVVDDLPFHVEDRVGRDA